MVIANILNHINRLLSVLELSLYLKILAGARTVDGVAQRENIVIGTTKSIL